MTAPAPSAGRAAHDPFAPAAGTPFPGRRLLRAGLSAEDVNRLSQEYAGMSGEQQRELARYVTRNPDSRILARFQGTRSRAELEALTVEKLLPLLRERHLSTDGRKAELIDRLLTSYAGGVQEQPTQAPQEAATAPEPTAPAGDAPDTPQPAQEADSGPAEAPAPEPVTGVDAPPQTPDAAPAPDTATPADPTTEEDSDRG